MAIKPAGRNAFNILRIGQFDSTFGSLQIGKLNALNAAYVRYKTQVAALEKQLLVKFEPGQYMFLGPVFQEPLESGFQLHSGVWSFSTCAPAATFIPYDAPASAHLATSVLRLFSSALVQARAVLTLVSGGRAILLRALQEIYRFVCIAVSQRATFAIHGLSSPGPSPKRRLRARFPGGGVACLLDKPRTRPPKLIFWRASCQRFKIALHPRFVSNCVLIPSFVSIKLRQY